MKTITAILALSLITGLIYHLTIVEELNKELYVEQQLFKACTAEIMWIELKLQEGLI